MSLILNKKELATKGVNMNVVKEGVLLELMGEREVDLPLSNEDFWTFGKRVGLSERVMGGLYEEASRMIENALLWDRITR